MKVILTMPRGDCAVKYWQTCPVFMKGVRRKKMKNWQKNVCVIVISLLNFIKTIRIRE